MFDADKLKPDDTQPKTPKAEPTPQEKAESRRQFWTKEPVDRRRKFCIQNSLDVEAVNAAKNDELVQWCMIIEGVAAGQLPLKKAEVKEPPKLKNC